MLSLRTPCSRRSCTVLLVFGLGLFCFAGGCGPSEQSQTKVDTEIPKGWEATKQGMRERMKNMRKQGGASPGGR